MLFCGKITTHFESLEEESSLPFPQYINSLKDDIHKFRGPPFTIQRLSELLVDPKRAYNSTRKLINALEKLIQVISIISLNIPKSTSLASSDEENCGETEQTTETPRVLTPPISPRQSPPQSPSLSDSSSGRKRKATNQSPGTRPLAECATAEIHKQSKCENMSCVSSYPEDDQPNNLQVKKEEEIEVKEEEILVKSEHQNGDIETNVKVDPTNEDNFETKKNKSSPSNTDKSFKDEKRQKNTVDDAISI
eukprot:Platyproteum_vivax@DN2128_c0_g1_i1.p1